MVSPESSVAAGMLVEGNREGFDQRGRWERSLSGLVDKVGESDDRNVKSRRLPGGDLVTAVLNRHLMVFADRGGSSGAVGQRWADLSALAVATFAGQPAPVPGVEGTP